MDLANLSGPTIQALNSVIVAVVTTVLSISGHNLLPATLTICLGENCSM